MAFVFALLAVVCFGLALIGASIGIDLVVLGLLFMAACLMVGSPVPTRSRR